MLEKIQADLQQAQKDHDEVKVSTLRLLLSELHNAQIQKGQDLSDQEIVAVVQREIKKRKEAASSFTSGGRAEMAAKEESEAGILGGYLPKQLSDEQLTKMVEDSINEVGATSVSDMGRVIGMVMSKAAGQVEGARVSNLVKNKLT